MKKVYVDGEFYGHRVDDPLELSKGQLALAFDYLIEKAGGWDLVVRPNGSFQMVRHGIRPGVNGEPVSRVRIEESD